MNSTKEISLGNVELTRFLFALLLLLTFSHIVGYLFQKFKIPRVVGEICGGLLLGPTVLGFFSPEAYEWIFNAFDAEGKLISAIYWLGLVLLMFISGFEVQKSFNREDKKILIAILLGSTIVPFLTGWFAPMFYDFSQFLGEQQNPVALRIIIAIAIAVTSIPVISKIFIDLGIINTRFAKIVLAAATIHDVILWVALAIATGLINKNGFSTENIISTVLTTIVFFLITLLAMPKLINIITKSKFNLLCKSSEEGYALFLCLLFASIASFLDVNTVYGAFLAGIALGSLKNEKIETVKINIKKFSLAFFIPIYFAIVGIKLDLVHHFDILFFLGFLLFSTAFQMIGTYISVKIIKLDNLSSFNFAIAMNARGGPGIVLATVAFDMGIINETFFAVLVVIAIVTSLQAGFWFKCILARGKPLLGKIN